MNIKELYKIRNIVKVLVDEAEKNKNKKMEESEDE